MYIHCHTRIVMVLIYQAIGHMVAPLKRLVAESVEWAKLEPAGEATVAHFIDSLFQDQSNISGIYFHTTHMALVLSFIPTNAVA